MAAAHSPPPTGSSKGSVTASILRFCDFGGLCRAQNLHRIRQCRDIMCTNEVRAVDTIIRFFEERLANLERAGIARQRVIVDSGMGFFLRSNPHVSFAALAGIDRIKRALGLPLLVSVSRKSFLRHITGRDATQAGPATLAAEIYAALGGYQRRPGPEYRRA